MNDNETGIILTSIMAFLVGALVIGPSCNRTTKAETKPVASTEVITSVEMLAKANGFNPSKRIVNAIEHASKVYNLDAAELTAIAILETGLGKYTKTRINRNGTTDTGLFQINSINYSKCLEYNLDTPEGSSLCAAKLLSELKEVRKDYLGAYHSKTPSKKQIYLEKLNEVMVANVQ